MVARVTPTAIFFRVRIRLNKLSQTRSLFEVSKLERAARFQLRALRMFLRETTLKTQEPKREGHLEQASLSPLNLPWEL